MSPIGQADSMLFNSSRMQRVTVAALAGQLVSSSPWANFGVVSCSVQSGSELLGCHLTWTAAPVCVAF